MPGDICIPTHLSVHESALVLLESRLCGHGALLPLAANQDVVTPSHRHRNEGLSRIS